MTCPECGKRPVKTRERCKNCYERHRYRQTLDTLPWPANRHRAKDYTNRHTDDACRVCEEVEDMHSLAFSGQEIADVLGMTPEAVHVHIRRHSPHLMHITIHASNEFVRERKRKATA